MNFDDICCKEAFEKFCVDNQLPPSDSSLRELARLVCDAVGAASLSDWLLPGSEKRKLLACIEKEIGPPSAPQIALADKLLFEDVAIDTIISRLTPVDVEAFWQARLAQVAADEEARAPADRENFEIPRG